MGKRGTSTAAMMFLCNWLNGFGKVGHLPISGTYLSGERVWIGGGQPDLGCPLSRRSCGGSPIL